MLQIYTDGGSRGNPGPSASAFVVFKDTKKLFSSYKFWGSATNNFAEYKAVVIAYEWLLENKKLVGNGPLNFFLDSELVVKQLTGEYRIKNISLKELALKVKELEKKTGVSNVKYTFVNREQNKFADMLVNIALDEKK